MEFDAPDLGNEIVRLIPLNEGHKDVLLKADTSDAMWRWLPILASGTRFDSYFSKFIEQQKSGKMYGFIAERVSDGAFAGHTAFVDLSRTHRRVRIGFNWHPEEMRGTNIFPATQLVMIKRALECRALRIEWMIGERNERAVAAYERIGAKREGILRNYQRLADGSWANLVVFSLLAEESSEVIKRLENHLGIE